ncbi:hypothetical protein BGW38_004777 [Lunasporangiospora selenospora]|uniref:DUF155 domain-containing protein n=1 Tax=Lunasporangiospora selenospora TaxID=979761 RepID=A0A9P6KH94_9FUNG|nr:hypothetical protein BGW38_004777 [Lunasporangiospora selenospora]
MARNGYQSIPDTMNATPTSSAPPPLPKSKSQNNIPASSSPGITSGSAGVPPKIINPTKQAFIAQANQAQSPISQIPGSANVTAKVNAAAAASNASQLGGSTTSSGGSRTAASSAQLLPTTLSPAGVTSGSAGSASALHQRSKIKQPMRTTKTSQKLTLFPEEKEVPVLEDEYAFDDTTYNQIGQLSSGIIYTQFSYTVTSKPPTTADLLGLDESATNGSGLLHQPQAKEQIPEVLFFDYGVVVIWGMSEDEEDRLLHELARFEEEKLDEEDVETEEFSFHYNSQYQPRIYNDVITLKSPGNYMVKLTISHAIAQSVKMTLFEGLIENTINATKHIPQMMAETGKVPMSRTAITKKIGQLFIMRINVNLVSNILDTPEIFWSEPSYQPLYSAIRGYLEIGQRVELLNQRTTVITTELAQRYQEKIQARKRGAGTHQSKFRGFSLAKSVETNSATNATNATIAQKSELTTSVNGTANSLGKSTKTVSNNESNLELLAGTNSKRVTRASTSKKESQPADIATPLLTTATEKTESQTIKGVSDAAAANSGLNERYQERLKARFRGAGAHQPGFRGFSLKTINQTNGDHDSAPNTSRLSNQINSRQDNDVETGRRGSRHSKRENENGQLSKTDTSTGQGKDNSTLATPQKKQENGDLNSRGSGTPRSMRRPTPVLNLLEAVPQKPKSVTGSDTKLAARSDDPVPRDEHSHNGPVPHTPGSARTRSTSRQSGLSPGFTVSWGKKASLVTTESSKVTTLTHSEPQKEAAPTAPTLDDTLPMNEDFASYDDDFGANDGYIALDHSEPIQPDISLNPSTDKKDAEQTSRPRDNRGSKRKQESRAGVDESNSIQRSESQDALPTTALTTAASGKRRRLIQEEADENEDPVPTRTAQVPPPAQHPKAAEKVPLRSMPVKEKTTVRIRNQPKLALLKSREVAFVTNKSGHLTSRNALSGTTKAGIIDQLRQPTLIQLMAKPRKPTTDSLTLPAQGTTSTSSAWKGKGRAEETRVDNNEDSDFEKSLSLDKGKGKAKSSSRSLMEPTAFPKKGPSGKTVKNYRQLQIQCLKFLGPTAAVSRPATVRNPAIAKQIPVEGEKPTETGEEPGADVRPVTGPGPGLEPGSEPVQKTIQSTLQVDHAPLSEMDVIAEAVRGVVDKFIDTMEDQTMAREIILLRSDLETLLIEQVDMLDDYALLKASVRKATGVKKELRTRLVETQRKRRKIRNELGRVRANFEREERARHRLEETHRFLTDLETLRDQVEDKDDEEEMDSTTISRGLRRRSGHGLGQDEKEPLAVKTGLSSFIATVASRDCSGGGGGDGSNKNNHSQQHEGQPLDRDDTRPGMLGTLVEFNRLLEKTLRQVETL